MWYFQSRTNPNEIVDAYGNPIERLFDPSLSPMHYRVPTSQLMVYDSSKQVLQLRYANPQTGQLAVDEKTVVVHIDGACRDNGLPGARASWGVYFGPGSFFNACGRLGLQLPHTNSRGEIEALFQALNIIEKQVLKDTTLQEIHIVSDSEYLVKTMSMWIGRWIQNGGLKADGREPAHFLELMILHDRLNQMKAVNFKFWHVTRDRNTDADALANQALDAMGMYASGAY
ncbi:hypothetical protein AAE478_002895 [Parahypoxylon ruwenzoriense]